MLDIKTIEFYGDVRFDKRFQDLKVEGDYKLDNYYIFNLECALSFAIDKPNINKIIVKGTDAFTKFKHKPLAVCLANNHIMDLGDDSFEQVLQLLKKENIYYFGAGKKNNNYNNPALLEFNDKGNVYRLALLGYCYDLNPLKEISTMNNYAKINKDRIVDDIKKSRDLYANAIIVYMHWGQEDRSYYNSLQSKFAHFLIDNGVDLVIGSHPHTIQPIEKYKNKYIYYSLGNSYFPSIYEPSYYNEKGMSKYIASVNFQKWNRKSISVEYDIRNNEVVSTYLQFSNDNEIKRLNKIDENEPIVPSYYRIKIINNVIGIWRRLILLLKSNIDLKKKYINIKAINQEFIYLIIKIKDFIFLHVTLFILALSFLFSKYASNDLAKFGVQDLRFIFNLGMYFILTVCYSFFWQLLLERFDLSFLYCNRAFHIIWTQLFAFIVFSNQITKNNLIGIVLIIIGVCLNSLGMKKGSNYAK